jgi:hypothetical protein
MFKEWKFRRSKVQFDAALLFLFVVLFVKIRPVKEPRCFQGIDLIVFLQFFTCSIKVCDALRHQRNAVRHERNASRHQRNAPRHIEGEVAFHLEHYILIEFQPDKEKHQESQSPCEVKSFSLVKVLN